MRPALRRIKNIKFTVPLILLILFGQIATAGEDAEKLPSIKSLSSLTNPNKLETLQTGNRAGNARFKKLGSVNICL